MKSTDGTLRDSENDKTEGVEKPPSWLRRIVSIIFSPANRNSLQQNDKPGFEAENLVSADAQVSVRTADVRSVAIPRADIVWVKSDIGLDELVSVFRESGRSRLPVASETLDEPKGFIHLKDLALHCGFNGGGKFYDLLSIIREPLYVPPSMPVHDLLKMMQAKHVHMALVIDEYGGVDGLVTIEDLVEQVFGEIADEHDVIEKEDWCVEEDPGVFRCSAKAPIDEVERSTGAELARLASNEDVDTLGGLVCRIAGRVPTNGEVVKLDQDVVSEVLEADARRIKSIRVKLQDSRAA